MPTIFFSYARPDAEAVDRIARDLRGQGVDPWLDRHDLRAGDEWLPQIETAISRSEFMLVFISQASVQSRWVCVLQLLTPEHTTPGARRSGAKFSR